MSLLSVVLCFKSSPISSLGSWFSVSATADSTTEPIFWYHMQCVHQLFLNIWTLWNLCHHGCDFVIINPGFVSCYDPQAEI